MLAGTKQRSWMVLVLIAIWALLASVVVPAQARAQEADAFKDGYVIWGIKQSWRNYIGPPGTHLHDGVVTIPDPQGGEVPTFKWPIKSKSYNPTTHELHLKLGGWIQFQSYPVEGTDIWQLDSTFKDLEVIISEQSQVISGTYIGRPRENPGGDFEEVVGPIAKLNINNVEPKVSDGKTTWDSIPSVGTPDFVLYPGASLDPLTIEYPGDGGKPNIEEKFDPQGSPLYEVEKEHPTEAWDHQFYFPTVDNAHINAMYLPPQKSGKPSDWNIRFERIDAVTLEQGEMTLWDAREFMPGVDDSTRPGWEFSPTYDAQNDTIYFAMGSRVEDEVLILSARWNDGQNKYVVTKIAAIPKVDSRHYIGGLLEWDPAVQSLLVAVDRGSDSEDSCGVSIVEYKQSNGAWKATSHDINSTFGFPGKSVRDYCALLAQPFPGYMKNAWYGGKLLVPFGFEYVVDGVRYQPGLGVLERRSSGDWFLSPFKYNDGFETPWGFIPNFSRANTAADGSLLVSGVAASPSVRFVDDPWGNAKVDDVVPDELPMMWIFGGATDVENGYDILHSGMDSRFLILRDRETISEIKNLPYASLDERHWSMAPGTIYFAAGKAEEPLSLVKYSIVARTAVFTKQPADQELKLTGGQLKGEATFDVDFEAESDTTIQWQARPAGFDSFEDIPGATERTLKVDASLRDSGTRYRAIVTNKAGVVASEPAELTVSSAPLFSDEPIDMQGVEDHIVTFKAPLSPLVSGTQRWEVLEDGQWKELTDQAGIEVDGSVLRIVATKDREGMTVRSVASNEVGTNESRAAKLTVLAPSGIDGKELLSNHAELKWDMSEKMQTLSNKAGFHHFLSAGASDGTADKFRRKDEGGNTEIIYTGVGDDVRVAHPVNQNKLPEGARQYVWLKNGTATIDTDGSVSVTWPGSWTVNAEAGTFPFVVSGVALKVDAEGNGKLTGQVRFNLPHASRTLEDPVEVVLATITGGKIDPFNPFELFADFDSVEIDAPDQSRPQVRTVEGWGSWPQSFVNKMHDGHLSTYFYTTGGEDDTQKRPTPLWLNFALHPPKAVDAPVITEHPASQVVKEGELASLSADAVGDPQPEVIWQTKIGDEWVDIEGADSPTYSFDPGPAGSTRTVRALFSNESGTTATEPATVTVISDAIVPPQPDPDPMPDPQPDPGSSGMNIKKFLGLALPAAAGFVAAPAIKNALSGNGGPGSSGQPAPAGAPADPAAPHGDQGPKTGPTWMATTGANTIPAMLIALLLVTLGASILIWRKRAI